MHGPSSEHRARALTNPATMSTITTACSAEPNSGPASSVIFWQRVQDQRRTLVGRTQAVLIGVSNADDQNLSSAVSVVSRLLLNVPSVEHVSADELLNWDAGTPEDWQARMDSGVDNAEAISSLIALSSTLAQDRNESHVDCAPLQGQLMASSRPSVPSPGPGSQGTDNGNAPRRLQDNPWEEADKALVTLAIDTSPSSHDVELDTEVSVIVKDMTLDADDSLQGLAEDSGATITVFSFSEIR